MYEQNTEFLNVTSDGTYSYPFHASQISPGLNNYEHEMYQTVGLHSADLGYKL